MLIVIILKSYHSILKNNCRSLAYMYFDSRLNNINNLRMTLRKIWLNCDPGHDDMLAIVMTSLSGKLDLIGVSTSAGNSTKYDSERS